MSKKCLKCGCELSNDNILYCPKCCDELYKPHKQEVVDKEDITRRAEATLSLIAQASLIIGIIVSVILFVLGLKICNYYREIGYSLLISTLVIMISSVTTWGVLKVLCNISNNLHEINKKMN